MLSPNTAQPERSVWNRVNQNTFETALDSLHRTKFVLEPEVLQENDWPEARAIETLPFAIEKQLSDDIAFLSAYEYGVRYVTAATVEAREREGLLVRLAANEGVCVVVEDAWKRLFTILARCAEKTISRDQCAEDAFDAVVDLNRNKILGRLASRHFRRPPHETGPARIPLSIRFKEYMGSSEHQSAESRELQCHVDALHAAFLSVEDSAADTETIKRVVKEAFRLTVDGISLASRLEKAGFTPLLMDTRETREINKIANYWRICHSLAHLSRSYRTLFAKIKLESIEPFAPSVRQGKSKIRYVHAEVQMLVYYETSGPPIWPRVIGASKEACFLCHSFIKAHGFFYVSRAHCQIYPQWTVPDLACYSARSLDRLRIALVSVNRDVASTLKQATCNRNFRPFPLQSSINLHKLSLPTPSVTTILSTSTEGTEIPKEIPRPRPRSPPRAPSEDDLLEFNRLSLNHSPASSLSAGTTRTCCLQKNSVEDDCSGKEPRDSSRHLVRSLCPGVQTRNVEPKNPEYTSSGWLDLHVYLEDHLNSQWSAGTFSRATITVGSMPDNIAMGDWNDHRLDLDKLAPGEQIVLSSRLDRNEDVNAGTEMSVILTYQQLNPIALKCSWHRAAGVRAE